MQAPSIQPPADAAERRSRRPVIAYDVHGLPAFDAAFYARARANASMVAKLVVPSRDARAFRVPAGQFFRIVSTEGPQVGDLNLLECR